MKVELGEIFEISSGGTPSKKHPEYYGGKIPWIKTGDLKEKYLYNSGEFITEEGMKNSSTKLYDKDTVLIAMYGATIGTTSILKKVSCTNQACAAFKKNDQVIPEYLYYFFKSQREKFIKDGVGGAQSNISLGYLKKVKIELLPISKQIEIVNLLDNITGVIDKRKKELELVDILIKARFVEMFGDPVHNPYGWNKTELKELADLKIGPFGSLLHKEDYIEGGHALVNPSHIVDGRIIIDSKLTVSEDKYEELSAYHLKVGDVVMGRRGEMGRCAVVEEEGLLCGTGSLLIRPKGKVTADYIQKIISYPTFKKTIEDMAVGQTMPNLNVPIVSGFRIITPPIEVQNSYYDFVAQVNKSKIVYQADPNKLTFLQKICYNNYKEQYHIPD